MYMHNNSSKKVRSVMNVYVVMVDHNYHAVMVNNQIRTACGSCHPETSGPTSSSSSSRVPDLLSFPSLFFQFNLFLPAFLFILLIHLLHFTLVRQTTP